MEETVYNPDPIDCPLCKAETSLVNSWIMDYRNGKKNIMEVAAAFECRPEIIQNHIKYHMAEPEITDIPSDMKAIVKNARIMITSLNAWYIRIIDSDDISLDTVNMSTKLAKAINDCLNTLAKIDGLIADDGLSTNYHKLEDDYNVLMELLTTEVCPKCRKKILTKLDHQK